ncbi:MAG: hypothetical protein U1E22_11150 [Coriobacteriia bacterium]|nr:hypothetical protein [Coriobacteriia bacterium]
MTTIFTVPKPFSGHIGMIQMNAIGSWCSLVPRCQVVLCGQEPGIAEVAAHFGVDHMPDVATNDYGTPLLDSVFAGVAGIARFDTMCYLNSDVMVLQNLLSALAGIDFEQYLMVGGRWDLALDTAWDFCDPSWGELLETRIAADARRHPPMGSDFFAFPRLSPLTTLPQFAVGRPGWDNWMIARARSLHIPVVDSSDVVTVVHQDHDYAHVPGSRLGIWEGPEADANRRLMGDSPVMVLADADWEMTSSGLVERSIQAGAP